MRPTYYRVTGGPVTVPSGALVTLSAVQASRRERQVRRESEIALRVVEPFVAKDGEVLGLAGVTLDKASKERLVEVKKAEFDAYAERLAERRAATVMPSTRTLRHRPPSVAPDAAAAREEADRRIAEAESRAGEAIAAAKAAEKRAAELARERDELLAQLKGDDDVASTQPVPGRPAGQGPTA